MYHNLLAQQGKTNLLHVYSQVIQFILIIQVTLPHITETHNHKSLKDLYALILKCNTPN